MATVKFMTTSPIHGFQVPLNWGDMKLANTVCNELPRMNSNMNPGQEYIKNLVTIIGKHKVTGKVAIELLHKHEDTPTGQVKLEVELKTMPDEMIKPILAEIVDLSKIDAALKSRTGKWTKPTQFDSLDLNDIHGVVFKLNTEENCLTPC